MARVIVIGGGISGLSVAFRLKSSGLKVTVLESESKPGGKAQTVTANGFTCEEATNGWLDKEPAMGELLNELNLGDRIQPSDKAAENRFIYRKGDLRKIEMHPLKFMFSSVLPFGSRLRLAMEPFVGKGTMDKEETLSEFAERRLGKRARDILIGPMASGVYAGDPSQMSLKSCFAKVYDLERRHGSLIKGMIALKKEKRRKGQDPAAIQAGPSGRLTSLRGGMSDLVHALVRELGDDLRTNSPVTQVVRTSDGAYQVTSPGQPPFLADAVVSAAPAWAQATYLEALDHDAAQAFAEIPYPSVDVVCLGYRREQVTRKIDGFGFLVPRGQDKTILGCLWTSSIFPGRAPDEFVLMRTMIGGMLEPQVAGWSTDQVAETVRRELADIVGLPKTEEPVFLNVFRHEKAIPQYHVGHGALIEKIRGAEKQNPGFFAAGNSMTGIGVIDCVRESHPLANRVMVFLSRQST